MYTSWVLAEFKFSIMKQNNKVFGNILAFAFTKDPRISENANVIIDLEKWLIASIIRLWSSRKGANLSKVRKLFYQKLYDLIRQNWPPKQAKKG